MGNLKELAYELYDELLHTQKDNIGNNDPDYMQTILGMKNKISCMVDGYLKNCRPEEKFRQNEFPTIIYVSLKDEHFHPQKTAEAFENLENYIVLIYLMPWKKEFHTINKYCGFYQAKIHAHMKNVESIFKLIGYTEFAAGMLVQTIKPDPELLKSVAFECLVASVECQIIYRISKRTLGYKISSNEIVQIALTQTGTEDQLVSCIQSKLSQNEIQGDPENKIDSQNTMNGVKNNADSVTISTDPFRNKLQNYMQQAEKLQSPDMDHDIPFMDEESKLADYTVGCLDEHILASLKLVEEISDPSASNDNMELKPSQEWSFVREGITKKYGEQYYDGIRKDILVNEKMDMPKPHDSHSGYIQLMVHTPEYVNVDSNFVQKPENMTQYGAFTGTIDSHNFGGCPIVNPPMLDVNKLRARGILAQRKQATDILAKKQLSPVSLGTGKVCFSQSAPLAKRHVEIQDSKPMSSFPVLWTDSYTKTSDEINMYKKRASAPLLEHDKDSGIGCYSSSSASVLPKATMTDSSYELLNKNVSDNSNILRVANNVQTIFTTNNLSSKSSDKLVAQYSKPLQWPCPFCTYLNSTSGNICSVCSKSRESLKIDTLYVGPCSRICHKCTLENENNRDTCNVCGSVLGATHTVV